MTLLNRGYLLCRGRVNEGTFKIEFLGSIGLLQLILCYMESYQLLVYVFQVAVRWNISVPYLSYIA